MANKRYEELETIARQYVGDGQKPDLFIVTDNGIVVTVTQDAHVAYKHWKELAARRPLRESALENRTVGTLASVGPYDDTSNSPLRVIDDSHMLPSLRSLRV